MNNESRARGLRRRGFLIPVLAMIVIAIISSVTAYAATIDYWDLKVGGEHVAYVPSEKAVKEIISTIESEYTEGLSNITSVKIDPAITFEKNTVKRLGNDINVESNTSKIATRILSGYDLKVTVERTEEVSKTIPFGTIIEEDSEMYDTDPEIIKVEGEKGSVIVTEKIVEVNKEISSKETVSFQEINPAVDKVVIKGTKEASYFVWPYSGEVTSYFGYRYDAPGTIDHQGIDISASYGDAVVAARSGVVTAETGWDGGYGLCVHIDHGDGIETLYGHNCELAVSPGETVEAGQVIAYAGTTGWSSGTHVHFEVRVDGTPTDPFNYL